MTRWTKDGWLAVKLRRLGARYAYRIIVKARAREIPLSWALALVEQESGFRNIFGADHGPLPYPDRVPFYHVQVTAARVRELLTWIASGGVSNGVGLTQLTSVDYIKRAERAGGAHKPGVQLDVGFQVFLEKTHGDWSKAWLYNGSPAYQPLIAAKHEKWKAVLM